MLAWATRFHRGFQTGTVASTTPLVRVKMGEVLCLLDIDNKT